MGDFDQTDIDSSESSLVQLLVKLNIVSQAQVTEALEYQCRLPQSERMTLEDILVDMEYLTPEALKQAHDLLGFDDAPPAPRTGAESRHASHLFGALFSEPRYEDAGEPEPLVKPQPYKPVVQSEPVHNSEWDEILSPSVAPPAHSELSAPTAQAVPAPEPTPAAPGGFQVAGAFAQRSQNRPGNWNLSTNQAPISRPVPAPVKTPVKAVVGIAKPQLGEILLKNHDIEEWQLTHALCLQRDAPQTTPKLGTLLVKLGYVQPQAVERALSLQINKV